MMSNSMRFAVLTALTIFAVVSFQIGASRAEQEVVRVATKPGTGSYLTDGRGMALYSYKKDAPGRSDCTGKCKRSWPVYCYSLEQISVVDGLSRADFASFVRPDNEDHLTYKGMPLYNFSGDRDPGDTNGDGVNNLWFLVRP